MRGSGPRRTPPESPGMKNLTSASREYFSVFRILVNTHLQNALVISGTVMSTRERTLASNFRYDQTSLLPLNRRDGIVASHLSG